MRSRVSALISKSTWSLAAGVLLVAACGGGTEYVPGTDEDYVRGVCNAWARFGESDSLADLGTVGIGAIAGAPDEEFLRAAGIDQEEYLAMGADEQLGVFLVAAFTLLGAPTRALADDLADLRPPQDIRPIHDIQVELYTAAADAFSDGDFSALMGDPIVTGPEDLDLPEDIRDRLAPIARSVSECNGSPIFQDRG